MGRFPVARILVATLIASLLTGASAPAANVAGRTEIAATKAGRLMDADRPEEALELIRAARKDLPPSADLAYLAGLAHLQLGNHVEAEAAFRDAVATDPDHLEGFLALGILCHRDGRLQEGNRFLERAVALAPEDERTVFWAGESARRLGRTDRAAELRERAGLLGVTRAAEGPLRDPEAGKHFSLDLWVGAAYDDNVTLEPDDGATGAADEDDFVGTISVGAVYGLAARGGIGIDLYYGGYVSGHGDLHDYDIQRHLGGIVVETPLGELLRASLTGGGEYTLVGGHSYRNVWSVAPAITFTILPQLETSLNFQLSGEHYFRNDVSPGNEKRTGTVARAGVRPEWHPSEDVAVWGRFGYVAREARAEEWDHEGFELLVGGEVDFAEVWKVDGLAGYESRRFDPGGDWPSGRDDDRYEVGAGVERRLGESWSVRLDYRYHQTDSDVRGYSYTQNAVHFSLGVRL